MLQRRVQEALPMVGHVRCSNHESMAGTLCCAEMFGHMLKSCIKKCVTWEYSILTCGHDKLYIKNA